jgi:hypothetical protein
VDPTEREPFGRRLGLRLHHLPRSTGEGWDWDLDRGFHLEVLSESLFELNLRPRGQDAGALPIPRNALPPGVTRILLWQKAPGDEGWAEFSSALSSGDGWRAGLVLSRWSERPWLPFCWRHRHLWSELRCPVVQLYQDTPAASFFTVEKNLFCLGRVGRRLERYSRWRSLLP